MPSETERARSAYDIPTKRSEVAGFVETLFRFR